MLIYNSFNRKKEEFKPIEKNKIKIYVCGQTIYDYCHLGHARKALVFDMVRRWFIASGFAVTFVENITDIDDKIIKRAQENGESIEELTNRFTQYMYEDFDKLGIMRPDLQPKATEYVTQMLNIIQNLVNKDYAYLADNGDVYYRVRKFADYGHLSGKSIDELNAGERVDIDQSKQDPFDFVLWKHAKENEIAQSEAHNGCKYANLWMHNGFLNFNDEKMSKSLGNFFTLREALGLYDAEVIRLFMLKTHYRSPLNFNQISLDEAKQGVTRLYSTLKPFERDLHSNTSPDWQEETAKRFKAAMDDDFNTSLAITILFELCNEVNSTGNPKLAYQLKSLANKLGLLTRNSAEFLQEGCTLDSGLIEELISQRKAAKINKNYALADKIRKDLLEQGIVLEDTPAGTNWRKQ